MCTMAVYSFTEGCHDWSDRTRLLPYCEYEIIHNYFRVSVCIKCFDPHDVMAKPIDTTADCNAIWL